MKSPTLTSAVDVETDGRPGQTVHKVPPGTGLHLHRGVPVAAVPVVAGTHRHGHDAVLELRVAAVQPDGSMRATVVFRDAEGGHGVAGHAREAVPFPGHVAVTQGHIVGGLVDMVLRVPPGLVQADVGRARVQDWGNERRQV